MTTPRTDDVDVAGATGRSPVERAEDLLGRLGERVGGAAASARRPRRRTTSTAADGPYRTAGPDRPAVDRAEDVMRQVEETIGVYATVIGRRLQRLAARAREEVEDIWAEAQHLRDERQRAVVGPLDEADEADEAHEAREPAARAD